MLFRNRVYKVVSQIPKGKVATYGQVAKLAGNSKTARAVGWLMKTNPHAPKVPCHRVIGSDGQLVGYSARKGLVTKKQLLVSEGVVFKRERIDLKMCLWKPKN